MPQQLGDAGRAVKWWQLPAAPCGGAEEMLSEVGGVPFCLFYAKALRVGDCLLAKVPSDPNHLQTL